MTDTEKALLDTRLAAYEKDPDAGSSWEEVEARICARLKASSSSFCRPASAESAPARGNS
ncbi:MAG: addiction module protein [Verrucomicrobia bacterium]|nr:addiction module protein [Verrucomicrobiota bacterium]